MRYYYTYTCPKGHIVKWDTPERRSEAADRVYCGECRMTHGVKEGNLSVEVERDGLLVERQKIHGSFATNAKISQLIKAIYNEADPDTQLGDVHREALDMIALKLSRILSGQADFKDHWDDIAGYARLASEVCTK